MRDAALAGPNHVCVTQFNGKQLTGAREGRPAKPIEVEVQDVFFIPGQPRTRKIFQRDHSGNITGFVERREGEDSVWRKAG